jgi:hypothetical protein
MDGTASQSQKACFRLAAACCRCPADACNNAVIAAVRDIDDWPLFLRVLRRHRIEALAQAALSAAAVVVSEDIDTALQRRARAIAQRNLAMAAETARLQSVLDAAGVPALVLKGAALAQLVYGSIAFKFSQDIDLLIAPESRDAAIGCLESDGYRLARPAPHLDRHQRALVAAYGREVALRHPERRIEVELRWQPVNSPSLLAGVSASSPHQDVALGDALSVRTLRDDDLFAYLCVHGGGHGWSRLQWLADLNAFIAMRDEAALLRLYRHAQAIGAGPCAMTALALCRRLFGRVLPAEIARDIHASMRTRLAVAMALNLMTGPDVTAEIRERRFGTTRVVLMQLLFGSSLRHYASLVRELCFRLDDMLVWPLPRALHFVYPLLRLPLWLWRKVAAAPRPRREAGSI